MSRRSQIALVTFVSLTVLLSLRIYSNLRPDNLRGSVTVSPGLRKARLQSLPSPPPLFPRNVWWKVGPHGLPHNLRGWTDRRIRMNNGSGWNAMFLDDASAKAFVLKNFHHRQDIIETYLGLPAPIFKADMLRYLILYVHGGVWLDLDVECLVPFDEWVSSNLADSTNLVVGMEFDIAQNEGIGRQFQSWAIISRPRSPHLRQVIEDMLTSTQDIMQANNLAEVTQLTMSMLPDVVNFSGPRRLTRGIWHSIELLGMYGANETDRPYEIIVPRLYGDVLVMPGHSFAFSNVEGGPYREKWEEAKKDAQGPPLVKHHYAGSWKDDKGGEY